MPARPRILVAEDDQGVRDLIRAQLHTAGMEVHTARDGFEAISQIATLSPAVLVLDINMPRLDGFGVLKTLQERGQVVPTLVLTARHAEADVRRAITLGAKDYLTKPFSEAQLRARVAKLLRGAARPPPAQPPETVVI
jgi:DNA-binding response OmpR family regulator